MAATTKKPTRLTAKQQKTVDKVRDVLEAYPLGIALDDLIKEANLTAWTAQQALSLVGASMRYDGLWQLPASKTTRTAKADDDLSDIDAELDNPSAAPVQDDGGNIQDKELNTQAPKVSYPDNNGATLINTPAPLVNPSAEIVNLSDVDTDGGQQDTIDVGQIIASSDDFHPEFAQLPDYQSSNGQAIETTSLGLAAKLKQLDNAYLDGLVSKAEAPNAEVGQATVNQKRFILIENCLLSLSRDEIGERPCLAKDCWFYSHGNDIQLESPDGQFLQKAAGGFRSDAIFRGEEYYRRYTLQSQLFHGVFDSPEDAEYRIAELMFIKPDKNHFEVIEV